MTIPQQGKKKERYWRDQIQKWQESGLSGREYCRLKEVSYWTFRDWKKRVEETGDKNLVKVPREAYAGKQKEDKSLEIAVNKTV